jgi:hypothetical protein
MSKATFWWVILVTCTLGAAGIWHGEIERRIGRAEMKRWQDSYYAEHPLVKEVANTVLTPGLPDGAIYYLCHQGECDWKIYHGAPAPKPSKRSHK